MATTDRHRSPSETLPDGPGGEPAAPAARFDFVDSRGRPTPLVFGTPVRVIEAWTIEEVRPAIDEAERAAASGLFAAGFVSYEAAGGLDPALTTKPADRRLPLVWFGVFTGPQPETAAPAAPPPPAAHAAPATLSPWSADVTPARYRDGVARVREAIAAGDSYQANYTFRLHAALTGGPGAIPHLYRQLVDEQRPPFAARIDLGPLHIVSLSPELFFRIEGRRITTRPMKGTAARGRFVEEDDEARAGLLASPKNRAENVMIVDLARNDLGRVSEVGSIRVASLHEIERYPSVFQMVSTVEGRLRPEVSLADVFAALFPAGSITGAPKTSSMRVIADIEATPRGVYCGAIGFVAPGGQAVFNVAIRTAVIDGRDGTVEYGVGGGITWDSTARDEHAEAISKASFIAAAPAFSLLETMRMDEGTYVRLERHVRRLAASADYFSFALDQDEVRRRLAEHAREHPRGVRRVRLLASRRGEVLVESVPFGPEPSGPGTAPRPVALAAAAVDSGDRFLFHKTTHRTVYEQRRRAHEDVFDVLLWNERGELTEFTIGNLVAEIEGTRCTPPRSCGLLAGVFREELIESGEIRERVLTTDDLSRCTRLWLVNSLREWVDVKLAAGAAPSQSPAGITSDWPARMVDDGN